MSAVNVTIVGLLSTGDGGDPVPVTLIGAANLTGLSVGGGPIIGGGHPPKPTFPIWGPPGITLPPGPGYPPVAGHPLPIPPPPNGGLPPDPPTVSKPPPPEGGWGYSPDFGWGYFPGPGQPTPKD